MSLSSTFLNRGWRLDESNILQIGTDGPNVNWKFYDNIKPEVENHVSPKP